MHRNKQIAIILPDTLQSIGLQSLLTDYFPPVEVCYFPAFEIFNAAGGNDAFDYYFTSPDIMVLNADFFLPRRSKTTVLIDGGEGTGGIYHQPYNHQGIAGDYHRAIAAIVY